MAFLDRTLTNGCAFASPDEGQGGYDKSRCPRIVFLCFRFFVVAVMVINCDRRHGSAREDRNSVCWLSYTLSTLLLWDPSLSNPICVNMCNKSLIELLPTTLKF
uniref:Secreted protein n=1 Tax=Steinernema glaseri TaxID=37863 RepID=A0A1I7Z585_9BILA